MHTTIPYNIYIFYHVSRFIILQYSMLALLSVYRYISRTLCLEELRQQGMERTYNYIQIYKAVLGILAYAYLFVYFELYIAYKFSFI